jgi:hypothetical protein
MMPTSVRRGLKAASVVVGLFLLGCNSADRPLDYTDPGPTHWSRAVYTAGAKLRLVWVGTPSARAVDATLREKAGQYFVTLNVSEPRAPHVLSALARCAELDHPLFQQHRPVRDGSTPSGAPQRERGAGRRFSPRRAKCTTIPVRRAR